MRDAQELFDRLSKLKTPATASTDVPRSVLKAAQWVKPELLCEVSFTEWTEDGHIRHPFLSRTSREDKEAEGSHDGKTSPSWKRAEQAKIRNRSRLKFLASRCRIRIA